MKKLSKLFALLLVFVTALSLIGCSSFGKLQKAFEKEGYTLVENDDLDVISKGIKAELNKKENEKFAAELKTFTKKVGLVKSYIAVVEFNKTDDMVNFVKSSETAKGIVKDLAKDEDLKAAYNALCEAGLVNGNCLVLSLDPAVINIVKNA